MAVKVIYPVGGQAMARKVKKLPNAIEMAGITPGDSVRICVCQEDFWVEVIDIIEGIIVGTVDNDLTKTEHGLTKGDVVQFHRDSVCQIFYSTEEPK